MATRGPSRLGMALRIRDAAIEIVEHEGRFENTGMVPVRGWRGNELSISYRTPFQKIPGPSIDTIKKAAILGHSLKVNLPYGLDIWAAQGKVLNIEWDHQNHVELVSFKRGEWENEVLQYLTYKATS